MRLVDVEENIMKVKNCKNKDEKCHTYARSEEKYTKA